MNATQLLAKYEPAPGVELEYHQQIFQARFSPCGEWLFAGSYDSTVQRWKVSGEEPELAEPIKAHNGWTQCIAFHPKRKYIYSADSWGALKCHAYDANPPKRVWRATNAHDGWITAVAVSPDGQTLASASNRGEIQVRSCTHGRIRKKLPQHKEKIFSLVYAPDGKSLVFGDQRGMIHQWDLSKNEVVRTFDASLLYALHRIQDCGGARHLSIDPQGRYLLCAGQREPAGGFAQGVPSILVFDWKSGKQVHEMPMGSKADGFAYDAQLHPDGFVMGISCAFPKKGHVWFWRPGDKEPFYTSKNLPNGRSLSLHPDGKRLAMAVSVSANRNGRPDGEYEGGTAIIRILNFPEQA